jgi:hypothetical protein
VGTNAIVSPLGRNAAVARRSIATVRTIGMRAAMIQAAGGSRR